MFLFTIIYYKPNYETKNIRLEKIVQNLDCLGRLKDREKISRTVLWKYISGRPEFIFWSSTILSTRRGHVDTHISLGCLYMHSVLNIF